MLSCFLGYLKFNLNKYDEMQTKVI